MMICGIVLRQYRNVTDDRRHAHAIQPILPVYIDRRLAKNYNDMFSRFHLIPELYGQTDGQICYINIARQYADAQ